jgi:hypothetical protein
VISILRNGQGAWCIGHQEGQHLQGICTFQGNGNWLWVSGCKPPPLDDILYVRGWSTAGYCNETWLRRLLTVRTEWSKK